MPHSNHRRNILAELYHYGPLSEQQLADKLDLGTYIVRHTLRAMRRDGLVAELITIKRDTWRLTPAGFRSLHAKPVPASSCMNPPQRNHRRNILRALYYGPLSEQQIADELDLGTYIVRYTLRAMRRDRLVTELITIEQHTWRLTPAGFRALHATNQFQLSFA